MNFKRNLGLILSSVMLVSALAGCGGSEVTGGYTLHDEMDFKHEHDDGIYEIAIVTKSSKSEYWNTVVQAMMDRADEFESVKVVEYSAENERDINGNSFAIENAIAWESDAIVVAASSADAAVGMIDYADEKHIPVVMVDSVANTNTYEAYVGIDHKEMGTKAAELMADGINDGGRIIIIGNLEQSAAEKIKYDAFVYEIEKNHPNITIITTEYCSGLSNSAYDSAKTLLTTYADIQGVFAMTEEATIGVANCVEYLQRSDRTFVVGLGESDAVKQALSDELINILFAQDVYSIGVNSFNTALAIIQGNELSDTEIYINYSIMK